MTIWWDKRLQAYRYSFKVAGIRHSGSATTKAEARTAREEHRKRILEEAKKTPTVTVFSQVANKYLDDAMRRFTSSTYSYKALVVKRFIDHHGDLPFLEITSAHIHDFCHSRPSNEGYNRHRKDLSTIWTWARRNYAGMELAVNPCLQTDKMPHNPKAKKVPSEIEVYKMRQAAKGDERDFIDCILFLSARMDEILRLKWSDVDFTAGEVTLWTRKRRGGTWQSDKMPMVKPLRSILERRLKERTQREWVFFNEKTGTRYTRRPKMMDGICRRAGLEPLEVTKRKIRGKGRDYPMYYDLHSLRHYGAHVLANDPDVTLAMISKMLRHRELRTTEIYLQSLDQSVRAAGEKLAEKLSKVHTEGTHQNEEGVTQKSVTP